jgi:hypothetical protein
MKMVDVDPRELERNELPKTEQNYPMPTVVEPKPQMVNGVMDIRPEENYYPIEDLPSKYLLYPEGTKILGRPLKVLECKKLAAINPSNINFVINDILRSAIKGIDVNNILSGDKLYIIFWLRANTYKESGFEIDFHCPKCNTESGYEFTLDNLQINRLESTDSMSLKLSDDSVIEFKMSTVADENRRDNFIEKYSKIINDIDENLVDEVIQIKSINGREKTLFETYEYLTNLSPEIYTQIHNHLDKLFFGIMSIMDVKCSNCGGESQTGVTFRGQMFLPNYRVR